MMKFQIMDHSGHSTIELDKTDPQALQEAQEKFNQLVKDHKMLAATRNEGDSEYVIARKFEDCKDVTMFRPQSVGG